MLVGKGLADGEGVRISACNSVSLQLVGVLRWARRSGAAVATGRDSRIGGARGLLRRVGLLTRAQGPFNYDNVYSPSGGSDVDDCDVYDYL